MIATKDSGFLSLAETADTLCIPEDELIELRSKGRIFAYRNGITWKFKIEEVMRYVREQSLDLPTQFVMNRTYKFEAIDATGGEIKDTIEAPSQEEASAVIRTMGYFVTKIVDASPATNAGLEPQLTDSVYLDGHRQGLRDGMLLMVLGFGILGLVCYGVVRWLY